MAAARSTGLFFITCLLHSKALRQPAHDAILALCLMLGFVNLLLSLSANLFSGMQSFRDVLEVGEVFRAMPQAWLNQGKWFDKQMLQV